MKIVEFDEAFADQLIMPALTEDNTILDGLVCYLTGTRFEQGDRPLMFAIPSSPEEKALGIDEVQVMAEAKAVRAKGWKFKVYENDICPVVDEESCRK